MALDGEPNELQQVVAVTFVAKDPHVLYLRVQSAPIALEAPDLRLLGVHALDVTYGTAEHPAIQLLERPGRDRRAEVVCPPSDERVETLEHLPDRMSL